MEKRILIIDDDFSLRKVISRALSSSKVSVKSVSTLSEAWVIIEKNSFDLIICDVMLPDGDGLELVKKVKKKKSNQPFIIISAKNNILTAIKADQLEVFEYLPKPLDLNDLTICVNKCLNTEKALKQKVQIDEKLPMIGTSLVMQQVYKNIAKITKTNHTVLIAGESGTGKELVARAIHNFSPRSEFPFVVINMASLPENLIESELFGYEKGAFTGAEKKTIGYFEKANGGTTSQQHKCESCLQKRQPQTRFKTQIKFQRGVLCHLHAPTEGIDLPLFGKTDHNRLWSRFCRSLMLH